MALRFLPPVGHPDKSCYFVNRYRWKVIVTLQPDTQADQKRARIIEGAMKVFLAYGFARTTMDDIARAADVSRPALYLVFKNKTDIYRAIAAMMLEASAETARSALAAGGPFTRRMMDAIQGAMISLIQQFQQSPHGDEILDMKNNLAADLIADWRNRLARHIADVIEEEATRNGTDLAARGLTSQALAQFLLDGLEGMKMRTTDPTEQTRAACSLVKVIELALRP
jgi:AcrR family transcriptional regulator